MMIKGYNVCMYKRAYVPIWISRTYGNSRPIDIYRHCYVVVCIFRHHRRRPYTMTQHSSTLRTPAVCKWFSIYEFCHLMRCMFFFMYDLICKDEDLFFVWSSHHVHTLKRCYNLFFVEFHGRWTLLWNCVQRLLLLWLMVIVGSQFFFHVSIYITLLVDACCGLTSVMMC